MDRDEEIIKCPKCDKIFFLEKQEITPRVSCPECDFEMDSASEIESSMGLSRFCDEIPFETIEEDEDNSDLQTGKKVAEAEERKKMTKDQIRRFGDTNLRFIRFEKKESQ